MAAYRIFILASCISRKLETSKSLQFGQAHFKFKIVLVPLSHIAVMGLVWTRQIRSSKLLRDQRLSARLLAAAIMILCTGADHKPWTELC